MVKNHGASGHGEHNDEAVLVAGGSGYIGRQLVPYLSDSGFSVVSMYHMRLPDPYPNVFPVCSDLSSVDLLAAPLRGVETIIYLAWENRFLSSTDEVRFDPSYKDCSPNIGQLRNLLEAAEKAGTKRFIFLSVVGSSRKAKNTYLREKYLAEVAVLNSSIPEKIILRSNVIFNGDSSSDQFIRSVMNVMKFPGFYPVPQVGHSIAPVHISDLMAVFKELLEVEMDMSSSILEISGSESMSVEDIFKLVSDRFMSSGRIQLRGSLGNSLVPIFEKRGEYYSDTGPKLRDYLAVGGAYDQMTVSDNPLSMVIPEKRKGFKEALLKNK